MANRKQRELFKNLKRLFSGDVIVRHVSVKGKKGTKILDTDSIQMAPKVDKFSRVFGNNYKSNINPYYSRGDYANARMELFRDYEIMDRDPIISSALDLYSEEATSQNEFGDVLSIKTENQDIQDVLRNLFYDILNVEFNLASWVRNMCKYGDFFLYLDIVPDYGIIGISPISAYFVEREEEGETCSSMEVKFKIEGNAKDKLEKFQIAHFRLPSDANYLPYGRSAIEGARKVWKQLTLMEDAMLIHRIMRAPEKRIFKIDVGNIPPNEVDTFMQDVMDKVRKVPFMDEVTGEYNLKFNMQNLSEDFFLPVRGSESGTSIDTLNGMEYSVVEEIEYLNNRMMAALRIPKAFLGYEEAVGSKATLAAEDLRFAKTIGNIQDIVVSELYFIAAIHLYAQGYTNEDLVNFDLELVNPSVIYEEEKINLWDAKIGLADNAKNTQMLSTDWIYTNVFGMSDIDVKDERERILNDKKREWRYSQIETEGKDPVQEENRELEDYEEFEEEYDKLDGEYKKGEDESESGNEENEGMEKIKTKQNKSDDPFGNKSLKDAIGLDDSWKKEKRGRPSLTQEDMQRIDEFLQRKQEKEII